MVRIIKRFEKSRAREIEIPLYLVSLLGKSRMSMSPSFVQNSTGGLTKIYSLE